MNLDDFRCKHGKTHEAICGDCEAEEQEELILDRPAKKES